jgi:cytochrome c biogenesis protein
VWALLTNVRFAVVQISIVVAAGLIGTLVRQIPSFALRDYGAYQRELVDLHARYDGAALLGWRFGPAMVDLFERLGFFRVFSSSWFAALATLLVISIVACTLDRLPRLWREARDVRVAQPSSFYDPALPHRAVVGGARPDDAGRGGEGTVEAAAVEEALARRGYRVRRAEGADDASFVYGDRNRYSRLATLLTHTGLVAFLAAGAVTGSLGYETVVFLADGQAAPVQPVGTPGNLLVRNLGFAAPRNPDGTFADFYSDIVVYQDGRELARKQIRVNDPLTVAGFTFHQNTFGPAESIDIRGPDGVLLWTGPVVLDSEVLGFPAAVTTVPGSDIGLQLVLARDDAGAPLLALVGYRQLEGSQSATVVFLDRLHLNESTQPQDSAGYTVTWTAAAAWTGLVVKSDPGAPIVWLAFIALISGIVLTFHLPRRRVWARVGEGRAHVVLRGERYVAVDRELDELVGALRASARGAAAAG